MNINYRILNTDEWERLWEVYPEGETLPSPMTASVAVAELDGKIVGAWFMQLAWHMEPLVIKDKSVDYKELAKTLTEFVPAGVQYFARSVKGRDHVAQSIGMKNTNEHLYIGG